MQVSEVLDKEQKNSYVSLTVKREISYSPSVDLSCRYSL